MREAAALPLQAPPEAPAAGASDAEPQLQASGPQEWRVSGDWTLLALRGRYEEFRQRISAARNAPGEPLWDLRDRKSVV